MDNKNYMYIQNPTSLNNNSKSISISFLIIPSINSLIPSLNYTKSNQFYSNNNIVITQPIVNKLFSEIIKEEESDNQSIQEEYSATKPNINQLPSSTVINTVHLDPINDLSIILMTNTSSHIMSTLNPAHLSDSAGAYFVSGLTDMGSNYKLPQSSNSDLPSPSSSSNSSNPPSSSRHPHQQRRHGEGGDPTRKREMRLQKNREAARECRRKKKEYIKCLEERVAGLENQNKALIEELRRLKELYCQREDTNIKSNNKTTTH